MYYTSTKNIILCFRDDYQRTGLPNASCSKTGRFRPKVEPRLDQARANLTRGDKIIPVFDSRDPTNLDSFPVRVLVDLPGPRGTFKVRKKSFMNTGSYDLTEKSYTLHSYPQSITFSSLHFYLYTTLFKQQRSSEEFSNQ